MCSHGDLGRVNQSKRRISVVHYSDLGQLLKFSCPLSEDSDQCGGRNANVTERLIALHDEFPEKSHFPPESKGHYIGFEE